MYMHTHIGYLLVHNLLISVSWNNFKFKEKGQQGTVPHENPHTSEFNEWICMKIGMWISDLLAKV